MTIETRRITMIHPAGHASHVTCEKCGWNPDDKSFLPAADAITERANVTSIGQIDRPIEEKER